MDIQIETSGDVTLLRLRGKLDAVTAPAFEQQVRALVEGGAVRLVVDLAGLEYISSAGLRGLLLLSKLVKARAGRACLAGVEGNVRAVFEMSGFTSLFEVRDSVAAARETFR